jgi:hypothetical protein
MPFGDIPDLDRLAHWSCSESPTPLGLPATLVVDLIACPCHYRPVLIRSPMASLTDRRGSGAKSPSTSIPSARRHLHSVPMVTFFWPASIRLHETG